MHPMSRLGSLRRCLGLGRYSGYKEMTFGVCVGDKVLHVVSAGALTCENGNVSPCIFTNGRKKYTSLLQQNTREAICSTQYGVVNDRYRQAINLFGTLLELQAAAGRSALLGSLGGNWNLSLA